MSAKRHGVIGHQDGSGPRPRIALAIRQYNNRSAVIISVVQGDVNTAQQWTEPATLQALLHLLCLMLKNLAQLDIIVQQMDNIPLFIHIQLHDLIHTAL